MANKLILLCFSISIHNNNNKATVATMIIYLILNKKQMI
jgi:hypothetical protein